MVHKEDLNPEGNAAHMLAHVKARKLLDPVLHQPALLVAVERVGSALTSPDSDREVPQGDQRGRVVT